MEEHDGVVQRYTTPADPKRGIKMFKDRVASMKSGPWLLGGEREEEGKAEGHTQADE